MLERVVPGELVPDIEEQRKESVLTNECGDIAHQHGMRELT